MKNPDDLFMRGLRGKLNAAEQRELGTLLEGDIELRRKFREERALELLLDRLPDAPVPSNFTALVRQQAEREFRGGTARNRPVRFAWLHTAFGRVAAGLAAVAVIGLASVHEYQKARREDVAMSVRSFTAVASAMGSEKTPPEEIFENFDAINKLSVPSKSDLDIELLAALQK